MEINEQNLRGIKTFTRNEEQHCELMVKSAQNKAWCRAGICGFRRPLQSMVRIEHRIEKKIAVSRNDEFSHINIFISSNGVFSTRVLY